MGHQLAHRDLILAIAGKLRQVGRDRIVKLDAPGFDQLHHRRGGGNALGQRGKIEDRIHGHRLPVGYGVLLGSCFQGSIPKGLSIDDATVVLHQYHRSGDGAFRNGLLHDGVDVGKACGSSGQPCRIRCSRRGWGSSSKGSAGNQCDAGWNCGEPEQASKVHRDLNQQEHGLRE